MPLLDQIQSPLLKANRLLHYGNFGIQLAQLEVVRRKLRSHEQTDIFDFSKK